MSKFVMECPICHKYAEAKTGWWIFGTKKIDCPCGYTIDVKTDKVTSKKCSHCGNDVVYDQSEGESALCPVCKDKINTVDSMKRLSSFTCPQCGGRTDVFSHGGARKEAQKLSVPFLGEVPLDIAIRANSDDGRPVVASMPESAHASAFLEIARRVADTLAAGAAGAKPAPRIRILE